MTQQEIKELARNMVGDGGTPNKWFVTYGPYVKVPNEDCGYHDELIDGYNDTEDVFTYGPFDTYEEAVECYEDQELYEAIGVGSVMIEDRQCGVVREKWLRKTMVVEYEEEEIDDSKIFYKQ
jgi:hypothetical protein